MQFGMIYITSRNITGIMDLHGPRILESVSGYKCSIIMNDW